jgi:hypothetical protein
LQDNKKFMQTNASPSETDKEREILLKQFRAFLHLAITAKQTGQNKQLKAMPGPDTLTYCMELADLPDNQLAAELAAPIMALLLQIGEVASICKGSLKSQKEFHVAKHAAYKRVLEQIDIALGLVLRVLNPLLSYRGPVAKDADFLCETLYADTHAGNSVANMVRRYIELFPDQNYESCSFVADFAWDVYQRVAELDRLADEYPQLLRPAARQMHGWPMLMHRHTNNRRRFQQLAKLLELGAEYPTDASEGARFRPDTPMVRYLDPLIYRLNVACEELGDREFKSLWEEQHWLYLTWWTRDEDCPNEEVLAVMHAARLLPPLTKATAAQWAEKAIVPLILVTDARDWTNCAEPVLQTIGKQKGVKSRATFKSRLLAAVAATLRRLARPA